MEAVDCQSYGGGFALGVTDAGFDIVAKREQTGGFGVPAMEQNRHILGYQWEAQSGPASEWEPVAADIVFGNPPCSGFSGATPRAAREVGFGYGSASRINSCMWDLVGFGARCNAEIIVFESVQNAYKKGRDLMLALREYLGDEWELTHCLHNNLSCGGFADRKRYFAVFSKVPFYVRAPLPASSLTLRDAIGDLEDVPLGGMDGHITSSNASVVRHASIPDWRPGEHRSKAIQRLSEEEQAKYPDYWRRANGFGSRKWTYDKPALVVMGHGPTALWHPVLNRPLTHRELARVMGYPDDWKIEPAYTNRAANGQWWGKGIPVASGKWIAKGALASLLDSTPEGYVQGTKMGDRERIIDVTNDWKGVR